MSEFSLKLFQNTTRAGFLFVKGTRMREQGSSKGEGTHGEISSSTFLGKLCHRRISEGKTTKMTSYDFS